MGPNKLLELLLADAFLNEGSEIVRLTQDKTVVELSTIADQYEGNGGKHPLVNILDMFDFIRENGVMPPLKTIITEQGETNGNV